MTIKDVERSRLADDVPRVIDQYANNMFRFERLHPKWIQRCAQYLNYLAGDNLRGKTVVDYGFGRGNWSVAFLEAGAEKVVAIDASRSNVKRFGDYCNKNKIKRIEIIHGNLLAEDIETRADIIWLYGILHHVTESGKLLRKLRELLNNETSCLFVYAYDAGSLRELIVETARRDHLCKTESQFLQTSLLMTPAARLRARDDLTAPYLHWYSAGELVDLLNEQGLSVDEEWPDFAHWSNGGPSGEFDPYFVKCRLGGEGSQSIEERNRPNQGDILVLRALTDLVLESRSGTPEGELISLGLFNTHFSALSMDFSARKVVVEDFLYMLYAALRAGLENNVKSKTVRPFVDVALAALEDAPRKLPTDAINTRDIGAYLMNNTIRI